MKGKYYFSAAMDVPQNKEALFDEVRLCISGPFADALRNLRLLFGHLGGVPCRFLFGNVAFGLWGRLVAQRLTPCGFSPLS